MVTVAAPLWASVTEETLDSITFKGSNTIDLIGPNATQLQHFPVFPYIFQATKATLVERAITRLSASVSTDLGISYDPNIPGQSSKLRIHNHDFESESILPPGGSYQTVPFGEATSNISES